jgi:hypothetical protein
MSRVRFSLCSFAVLMFGSLALANCGAPAPGETAATAEPAEWVVRDTGAGPIRIGMTADELRPHVEALGQLEGCVYAKAPAAPGLLVMLFAGKVVRVDVITEGLATAAGVRVGDTEERVRELYPELRVEPHKYTDGHYLVVDGDAGRRLVFETDGARVTRYRAGAIPQVDWVEGCS